MNSSIGKHFNTTHGKVFMKKTVLQLKPGNQSDNNTSNIMRNVIIINNNNKNSNNSSQGFVCDYCDLPFQKLNHLRKHINKCHSDDESSSHFQCCDCMRVFPTFIKLMQHDVTSHQNPHNETSCPLCVDKQYIPAQTLTGENLMSHYMKLHRKELNLIEKLKKYIIWKKQPRNFFQCTLCFGECTIFEEFLVHMATVHGIDTSTSFNGEIVCEYCGRIFPLVDEIVKHILRSHWKEASSSCVKCGKDFGSVYAAKKHFRSYCCPVFQDELNDLGVILNRDMYKEPTKTIQCPECDTVCRNNSMLKIHMRKHTGEKPFKCDECNLSFTQVGNFNKHKVLMHGEMKKSTPARECRYPCGECGRKFITMADVRAHERIHTGEKPFTCPHCKRGFTQRGNLNIHLKRWHLGVKKIPLGSTPTFKVNRTNKGGNEDGAEFKIFYFTVPVPKKNSNQNSNQNNTIVNIGTSDNSNNTTRNTNTDNNNINNSTNSSSNNNTVTGKILTKVEGPNTGGVFSKFKAEKPRRKLEDDNSVLVFAEDQSPTSIVSMESPNDLATSQDRLLYLPFDMIGDYCVTSVEDNSSYCSTPQVVNHTVITSVADPLAHDHEGVDSRTSQCLAMYTEVIHDHVSSDSYLHNKNNEMNSSHSDVLRNNEHHHVNTIVPMTSLENDVFTINDNSNKDLSTMNVEELFRTSPETPGEPTNCLVNEDSETMKFLDFSKTTSINNTMECAIPNDFHTLNWLHNNSPLLDSHVSLKQNHIPTVLKNVSGGEIRDLDTLDLCYTRHY